MRLAAGVEVEAGTGEVGGVVEVAGIVVDALASILVHQLGLTLGMLHTHTMGRHIMGILRTHIMGRPIIHPRLCITLRCSLRR
ncbi:conserved hypothetical protein [Candidatus Nitrotoga sp. HW29]|uniref:hypothetical protein n=1 Tax=Candidatus Nitrotoga sp. HW29 TaxID=2886963 RepID=UPI001EF1E268|nr:hypothetical protein [Candidatus Nitrotoga sp. HW29]CAH1904736.1 conserved hypothetical protein [Candidatus Nitrotoga sp. HW29]